MSKLVDYRLLVPNGHDRYPTSEAAFFEYATNNPDSLTSDERCLIEKQWKSKGWDWKNHRQVEVFQRESDVSDSAPAYSIHDYRHELDLSQYAPPIKNDRYQPQNTWEPDWNTIRGLLEQEAAQSVQPDYVDVSEEQGVPVPEWLREIMVDTESEPNLPRSDISAETMQALVDRLTEEYRQEYGEERMIETGKVGIFERFLRSVRGEREPEPAHVKQKR